MVDRSPLPLRYEVGGYLAQIPEIAESQFTMASSYLLPWILDVAFRAVAGCGPVLFAELRWQDGSAILLGGGSRADACPLVAVPTDQAFMGHVWQQFTASTARSRDDHVKMVSGWEGEVAVTCRDRDDFSNVRVSGSPSAFTFQRSVRPMPQGTTNRPFPGSPPPL